MDALELNTHAHCEQLTPLTIQLKRKEQVEDRMHALVTNGRRKYRERKRETDRPAQ